MNQKCQPSYQLLQLVQSLLCLSDILQSLLHLLRHQPRHQLLLQPHPLLQLQLKHLHLLSQLPFQLLPLQTQNKLLLQRSKRRAKSSRENCLNHQPELVSKEVENQPQLVDSANLHSIMTIPSVATTLTMTALMTTMIVSSAMITTTTTVMRMMESGLTMVTTITRSLISSQRIMTTGISMMMTSTRTI